MTSPDGASHWGPREKPPFELANYKQDLKQALQQREARMRRSSDYCGTSDYCGQGPDWIGGSDEEDDDITPQGRKYERQDWCTTRDATDT